eukprot:scaffold2576_cov71-Skeletonema_dohrnii-CCMP3373.AAC.2
MMIAAGETKEIGSDNSRHLTHHDHGVPTYSTQFRRVSFASCDHPLRKEVDKISKPPSTEAQNDAPGYAADVCHYGGELLVLAPPFLTCPLCSRATPFLLTSLAYLLHIKGDEDVETRSLNASDMLYDSPPGKFNIYSSPYYSLYLEPVHSWLC